MPLPGGGDMPHHALGTVTPRGLNLLTGVATAATITAAAVGMLVGEYRAGVCRLAGWTCCSYYTALSCYTAIMIRPLPLIHCKYQGEPRPVLAPQPCPAPPRLPVPCPVGDASFTAHSAWGNLLTPVKDTLSADGCIGSLTRGL